MDTPLNWPDLVGLCGVATVLGAHAGLQSGRLNGTSLPYQGLNILGSLLILVSLYHKPNLPSIVAQVAWITISFYGMWRSRRSRHSSPSGE